MGSILKEGGFWSGGWGFAPATNIRLYVVRDRDFWENGTPLSDVSGGAEQVTTDGGGGFAPVVVWESAEPLGSGIRDRDFDVVADVNRNGQFDAGDVVYLNIGTGFTVQGPPVSPPLAQLAAKTHGSFADTFDVTEDVGVWVNPPSRPLTPYQLVAKYIVLHKEEWSAGDPLVDVTGRPEWDMMRYACANQYHCPVWVGPLRPGLYDVIVDLNANGQYDPGVDILDDGRAPGSDPDVGAGFRVRGDVPPLNISVGVSLPAVNEGDVVNVYAQITTGAGRSVQGTVVRFSIVSGVAELLSDSATTNERGIALVGLRATRRNQNIVVRGEFRRGDQSGSAEAFLRVRDFGELQAVFRH